MAEVTGLVWIGGDDGVLKETMTREMMERPEEEGDCTLKFGFF